MITFYKGTRPLKGRKGEVDIGLIIAKSTIPLGTNFCIRGFFLSFTNFEFLEIELSPDSETVPDTKRITMLEAINLINAAVDDRAEALKQKISGEIDKILEEFR